MKTLSFCSLFALTLAFAAPAAAQPNLDGINAACCGGGCCRIDGTTFTQGDINPNNPCEMCDRAFACSAWTNICDAGPGGTDAGPVGTDAGPVGTDAGPVGTDAGPVGTDAGPVAETDAGPIAETDAGSTGGIDAGPVDGGGGGCAVAHSDSRSFSAILALAALGLFLRRRNG